jgi:hypothetical protein
MTRYIKWLNFSLLFYSHPRDSATVAVKPSRLSVGERKCIKRDQIWELFDCFRTQININVSHFSGQEERRTYQSPTLSRSEISPTTKKRFPRLLLIPRMFHTGVVNYFCRHHFVRFRSEQVAISKTINRIHIELSFKFHKFIFILIFDLTILLSKIVEVFFVSVNLWLMRDEILKELSHLSEKTVFSWFVLNGATLLYSEWTKRKNEQEPRFHTL